MKHYITLIFCLISTLSFAQIPQSFSYQAVARNASNDVIANTQIGIKVSIVSGSETGATEYSERHEPTTNTLGLFHLKIGEGSSLSGDMAVIDWGADLHFLKVEADFNGGTDYIVMGTSQILSVPYALHAETVANTDDADADPSNEIQNLSIEGNILSISNGNSINLPVSDTSGSVDADADPNNEIQDLSSNRTNDTVSISISKGGESTQFSVADNDASPTNEIQTLTKTGNSVTLSNGGGSFQDDVEDADSDPNNELQSLSLSGNQLSISNGNSVDLPMPALDEDSDSTNELQSLSLVALFDAGIDGMTQYELHLSDSDPVTLPYNEYWQATILLSDPPQVGNIHTIYPVDIQNQLNAITVEAVQVKSPDVLVGTKEGGATHILTEGIHFDPPVNDFDLGFFLEQEEITYRSLLPSNDFKAKLTKESLTFANDGGFTSAHLGGNSMGSLQLYPGGGGPEYFDVSINGSPYMQMRNGHVFARLTQTTQSAGDFGVFSDVGNQYNVRLSHVNNNINRGWLGVYNAGDPRIQLFIDGDGMGRITGDIKNFRMQHPEDENKEIFYASIEGPEAAAYERGTAQLVNGEATISFSDHFKHVIGEKNITVMITPLSAESKGIAVVSKNGEGFSVKELFQGTGQYEFDWEVKAVRSGYEDYQVIMDKAESQIPEVKTQDKAGQK